MAPRECEGCKYLLHLPATYGLGQDEPDNQDEMPPSSKSTPGTEFSFWCYLPSFSRN